MEFKDNLTTWEYEDLEDLFEKYPDINTLTDEELDRKITELVWEAQGLYEEASRIEDLADVMRLLKRVR